MDTITNILQVSGGKIAIQGNVAVNSGVAFLQFQDPNGGDCGYIQSNGEAGGMSLNAPGPMSVSDYGGGIWSGKSNAGFQLFTGLKPKWRTATTDDALTQVDFGLYITGGSNFSLPLANGSNSTFWVHNATAATVHLVPTTGDSINGVVGNYALKPNTGVLLSDVQSTWVAR